MKSQILIYPTMSRTEYCCRIFAFLISRRTSSPLGRYGRMALAYLRENHPERYAVLKMDGNLMKTMHRVQRDALERMEHLTQQMLLDDPVPETEDLLERARHWNDLKSMAEKIVLQTTVFRVR